MKDLVTYINESQKIDLHWDKIFDFAKIINTNQKKDYNYYKEKFAKFITNDENLDYISSWADYNLWGFWGENEPSCDKLTYAICKTFKHLFKNIKVKFALFGNLDDFYHFIPIICFNNKEIVIDLTYPGQGLSKGFIYEYNKNLEFTGSNNQKIKFTYEGKNINELPTFSYNDTSINWDNGSILDFDLIEEADDQSENHLYEMFTRYLIMFLK